MKTRVTRFNLTFSTLMLFSVLAAAPVAAQVKPAILHAAEQATPQLVHHRHRHHHWKRHHFHRHHLRLGHRIHRLPRGVFRIALGTAHYYFHAGVFYRPAGPGFVVVKAPHGAVVAALPIGHRVIHRGHTTYYHYNDPYYTPAPSGNGYVVVPTPLG